MHGCKLRPLHDGAWGCSEMGFLAGWLRVPLGVRHWEKCHLFHVHLWSVSSSTSLLLHAWLGVS